MHPDTLKRAQKSIDAYQASDPTRTAMRIISVDAKELESKKRDATRILDTDLMKTLQLQLESGHLAHPGYPNNYAALTGSEQAIWRDAQRQLLALIRYWRDYEQEESNGNTG